jgi:hypothetical protein
MKTLLTFKRIALIFVLFIRVLNKSEAQTVHYFSNLDQLLDFVGYMCVDPLDPTQAPNVIKWPNATPPYSPALPGDIIRANPGTIIDLDDLSIYATNCGGIAKLPLLIPEGVTLKGDYDLLGNDFTNPDDPSNLIDGKPDGTLFFSKTYRSQYDGENSPSPTDCRSLMYFFAMHPGKEIAPNVIKPTAISHIRIQGPAQNWTEFNIGFGVDKNELLCGGIQIWRACKFHNPINDCQVATGYGNYYKISNCEISGFSLAGIFVENSSDNITIDHCYIHHTKGISSLGIGYGIWIKGVPFTYSPLLTSWNINVFNNIFDDNKDAFDGFTEKFNVNFQHNTLTQFAGGINRHNNFENATNTKFTHIQTQTTNCSFFHRGYPVENSTCEPADAPTGFVIDDLTQGNSWYKNNIFHKNAGISQPFPADQCSSCPPSLTDYYLAVSNNTFSQPHEPENGTECNSNPPVFGQNL